MKFQFLFSLVSAK